MNRKTPTQREIREMVKLNKDDGAYYLIIFNRSGRPECSRTGTLKKREAEALFDQWVIPSRRSRRAADAKRARDAARKGKV